MLGAWWLGMQSSRAESSSWKLELDLTQNTWKQNSTQDRPSLNISSSSSAWWKIGKTRDRLHSTRISTEPYSSLSLSLKSGLNLLIIYIYIYYKNIILLKIYLNLSSSWVFESSILLLKINSKNHSSYSSSIITKSSWP